MSFVGDLVGNQVNSVPGVLSAPQLSQNNPFTRQFNNQAGQIMGQANMGAQANTAQQQQAFINALQQQAAGQGPSVTQQAYQNALQNQAAQTNALMGSARGGTNPALLQRMAMQQNAAAGQNAAGQMALGRLQEQQMAQGQLGQALTGMRGQDIQNALGMGQLAQGYNQMGLGAAQANLGAQTATNQANAQIAQSNAQQQGNLMGGLIGGGAAILAASDGGYVHGGKVNSPGDSPKNDTVPALLSPGEIVVPRSKTKSPDKAKEFIDHVMKSGSKEEDGSYGKLMAAHKKLQERVKALESRLGKGKK